MPNRTPRSEWGRLFNFAGGGLVHFELFPITMSHTSGLLGQSQPAADTWTTLYTCPSAVSLEDALLLVANLGPDVDQLSIAATADGSAVDDSQTIYPTIPINPADTFAAAAGLRLQATGKLYVKSLLGQCVFSLFAQEVA